MIYTNVLSSVLSLFETVGCNGVMTTKQASYASLKMSKHL